MKRRCLLITLALALAHGCGKEVGDAKPAAGQQRLYDECLSLLWSEMDTGTEEGQPDINAWYDALEVKHGRALLLQTR